MRISRKVKLLILLLAIPITYIIFDKTNYNNITYTAIGDGLTLGIDSYGQKIYSYNDYTIDYLKDIKKLRDYNLIFSSPETTIEMVYNKLLKNEKMNYKNTKTTIRNILNETDYLVISLGLNDLIYKIQTQQEINGETINIIMNELDKLFDDFINEVRKSYNGEIYVVGYYEPIINNKIYTNAIKKLNNIYKENDEVIYISTSIISENNKIFLPNPSSYYPNYKGYQAISSKIIDKISKKLEK